MAIKDNVYSVVDPLSLIVKSVFDCRLSGVRIEQFFAECFTNHITVSFLCPQRNFGRHIVIALSVRPSCFRVRSISPIFFEVGIPNLVCGCILGWRSVAYHFRVTVTLT